MEGFSFGKNSDVWTLLPLCIMWTVWQERNRHSFEDVESMGSQLLGLFASSL
jgi:hypothetical protein